MASEFVSLLIPRTLDSRYLLLNFGGQGLWIPSCDRTGDESLKVVATKLGEQVIFRAGTDRTFYRSIRICITHLF